MPEIDDNFIERVECEVSCSHDEWSGVDPFELCQAVITIARLINEN